MPFVGFVGFSGPTQRVFPCVSECYDDEPTTPVFSGEDATKPEVQNVPKTGGGDLNNLNNMALIFRDALMIPCFFMFVVYTIGSERLDG